MRIIKFFLMFLIISLVLWSCSGGGGSGSGTISTGETSRASLTVLVDPATAQTTRAETNSLSQGKASLIVDMNNDGIFDENSGDKKYEGIIDSEGKVSFKDVEIPKGETVKAMLRIEKYGRAPYEKIVELSENATLTVRVTTTPVQKVTTNVSNTVTLAKRGVPVYLVFSLKKDATGAKRIEVRTSTRRDVRVDPSTELQAVIPGSLFSNETTQVTASMKRFSGVSDRDYFPGSFEGVDAPGQYKRRDGSNTYKLKSIAFSLIKLEDQNGKPIEFQTKRDENDSITVTIEIPEDAYSLITEDADNSTSGVEVPIYRYRDYEGNWEYVGLGNLTCDGQSVNATELINAGSLKSLAEQKGYTYCQAKFNVSADEWSEYLNIDYPVWFGSEPKEYKVCIRLKDREGNPLSWADVWTEKGPTSFYGWTDSQGLVTFNIPVNPNISDPLTEIKNNYDFYYAYYSYGINRQLIPNNEFSNNTNSSLACDYIADVTVSNTFDAKVTVLVKDKDGNFLKNKWVDIWSEDYNYWNSKTTDENGTVTFSVKSNVLYYVYILGSQRSFKVDGIKNYDEDNDTGQEVILTMQKLGNNPPQIYVWVYPDPVRQGANTTAYISAWDPDGDNVKLEEVKFGGKDVKDCLESGYGYWTCTLNTKDFTNSADIKVKVSDGTNSTESTYTVTILSSNVNNPPQIYGIMIYENSTGYPVWDWNKLKKDTAYRFEAYGWDPDGDPITYTYNTSNGTCSGNICTFNSTGKITLTVTADDDHGGTNSYSETFKVVDSSSLYEIQSIWVDELPPYQANQTVTVHAIIYDPETSIEDLYQYFENYEDFYDESIKPEEYEDYTENYIYNESYENVTENIESILENSTYFKKSVVRSLNATDITVLINGQSVSPTDVKWYSYGGGYYEYIAKITLPSETPSDGNFKITIKVGEVESTITLWTGSTSEVTYNDLIGKRMYLVEKDELDIRIIPVVFYENTIETDDIGYLVTNVSSLEDLSTSETCNVTTVNGTYEVNCPEKSFQLLKIEKLDLANKTITLFDEDITFDNGSVYYFTIKDNNLGNNTMLTLFDEPTMNELLPKLKDLQENIE